MAIQWDYNEDYIGRYEQWQEQNQGYCKCNMYTGNCLFICNWETQKTATLAMFAADEQHLKNCLANKESKLFNAKDRFVFNVTDNKYQMAKIKKAIALLTGVVTIEIRPKENPIEKYYNTKQEEKSSGSSRYPPSPSFKRSTLPRIRDKMHGRPLAIASITATERPS